MLKIPPFSSSICSSFLFFLPLSSCFPFSYRFSFLFSSFSLLSLSLPFPLLSFPFLSLTWALPDFLVWGGAIPPWVRQLYSRWISLCMQALSENIKFIPPWVKRDFFKFPGLVKKFVQLCWRWTLLYFTQDVKRVTLLNYRIYKTRSDSRLALVLTLHAPCGVSGRGTNCGYVHAY